MGCIGEAVLGGAQSEDIVVQGHPSCSVVPMQRQRSLKRLWEYDRVLFHKDGLSREQRSSRRRLILIASAARAVRGAWFQPPEQFRFSV
jgi:hypothetical protein